MVHPVPSKAFLQTSPEAAMLFQPSKQYHLCAKNYLLVTVTTISSSLVPRLSFPEERAWEQVY